MRSSCNWRSMNRPALSSASCEAVADVEAGIAEPSREDGIPDSQDTSVRRRPSTAEKEARNQAPSAARARTARAPNERFGAGA